MENMLKELRSTVFLFHAFCDTVWLLDSGRFIDNPSFGDKNRQNDGNCQDIFR